jgi:hypothetical protein
MSPRRRLSVAVVGTFVVVVILLAFVPWTWHGLLATPTGRTVATVAVKCGAPFGADYVRAPTKLPYAIVGVPCRERAQFRLMATVDVILGVLALIVILAWGRLWFAERTG